jgi:D-sedoheptulose 7-phosphate isomerase
MSDSILDSFREAQTVLNAFTADAGLIDSVQKFAEAMVKTLKSGGTVFSCGNGGSACDAQHLAQELTGRYRKERRPLAALALTEASQITCIGNDYGFDEIFSRPLEALGKKNDLFVAISTSGNSPNVINAVHAAKQKGIYCVGLLGRDGGKMRSLADLPIVVPAKTSDRVQEMHIKIIHVAIEAAERQLFPENYK